MDPRIWGNLKYYVDLQEMVYAKLPVREFFRLRLVCKEWNALACDPQFLRHAFTDPKTVGLNLAFSHDRSWESMLSLLSSPLFIK
jgi:hypothetical protein